MQVTAASRERRGQAQAGAFVGDFHRQEWKEPGHPQEQSPSEDSETAGGDLASWGMRSARPPSPPETPRCINGGSHPGTEA